MLTTFVNQLLIWYIIIEIEMLYFQCLLFVIAYLLINIGLLFRHIYLICKYFPIVIFTKAFPEVVVHVRGLTVLKMC